MTGRLLEAITEIIRSDRLFSQDPLVTLEDNELCSKSRITELECLQSGSVDGSPQLTFLSGSKMMG